MAKKGSSANKSEAIVTRPQTDDEGSVASEDLPTQKLEHTRNDKSKSKAPPSPEEEAEEDEESAEEDEESAGEEDDEAEEEDDEAEEEDDDDVMGEDEKPKERSSVGGQKSLKSTKKPLGKPGTTGSVRKRLEMELAPAAVRRRIKQERFTPNTSQATGVFLASALETFMRELIDTAVGMAQERKGNKTGKVALTVQDIQKAVRVDEEFANIFQNVMFATHSVKAQDAVANLTKANKSKKISTATKA